MFDTLPLVLLVVSFCPVLADPLTPNKTYSVLDPITNRLLECDTCPPGTHLVSKCSASLSTECAPCPEGSYTQVWNVIGRCLRCQSCDWNQRVESECTADSDRQCQCVPGYYLETISDSCLPHRKCPSGEGVVRRGTPEADTECRRCPDGTFSDQKSAEQECVKHRHCASTAGLQRVLQGTSWHDSICGKCDGDIAQEAVEHLRGILPMFFTHHRIPHRLQRRIYNKLLSRTKPNAAATRSESDLQAGINAWVSTATATELQKLPAVLQEAGVSHTADKLMKKLQHIRDNMKLVCG